MRSVAPPASRPASPDDELRRLLRRVRQIELRTKKSVNAHALGAYHSRFKGRGMAFDESRAYVPGDDPRHIDWNVTARTGELFVKQFVEERELTVLLAVDVSGSFSVGSRAALKRQLAAEASALLAFSALRSGDKVGLLLFSDRVERLIRPRKGRSHVMRILREILSCRPQGRQTDLCAAVQVTANLSRQRAIVVLVTDFLDPALTTQGDTLGPIERPLRVLARRHDLMALEVLDPLEKRLLDVGLLHVRDAESLTEVVVDTSSKRVRDLYAARFAQGRAQLRQRLTRLGIEHLTLRCGDDSSNALVRFLRRRAKRMAA